MLQNESACLFCAYVVLFILQNLITIHTHRLLYFVIYDVHIPLYQGKLLIPLAFFIASLNYRTDDMFKMAKQMMGMVSLCAVFVRRLEANMNITRPFV